MTMTDTVGDYVDALKSDSLDADLLALYGKAELPIKSSDMPGCWRPWRPGLHRIGLL